MTFFATASGLMMESVRSIAMVGFPGFSVKKWGRSPESENPAF
jgi:hypothetical protein